MKGRVLKLRRKPFIRSNIVEDKVLLIAVVHEVHSIRFLKFILQFWKETTKEAIIVISKQHSTSPNRVEMRAHKEILLRIMFDSSFQTTVMVQREFTTLQIRTCSSGKGGNRGKPKYQSHLSNKQTKMFDSKCCKAQKGTDVNPGSLTIF